MALWAEVSGWFGAVVVLIGYASFSMGWIANGKLFQLSNLVGSASLIVNGAYHGAWPSVALNLAWGTIAAAAMARLQRRRASLDLTTTDGNDVGVPGGVLMSPERHPG